MGADVGYVGGGGVPLADDLLALGGGDERELGDARIGIAGHRFEEDGVMVGDPAGALGGQTLGGVDQGRGLSIGRDAQEQLVIDVAPAIGESGVAAGQIGLGIGGGDLAGERAEGLVAAEPRTSDRSSVAPSDGDADLFLPGMAVQQRDEAGEQDGALVLSERTQATAQLGRQRDVQGGVATAARARLLAELQHAANALTATTR